MKKIYSLFLIIFMSASLLAQSYSSPESAVYDHVNDQYLISNAGNGTIVAVDVNTHSVSNFVTSGLNSPKGMYVKSSMLYVTDVTQIHIINLNTGVISQTVPITDAQQLNDITHSGDTMYISDMAANKIFYMTSNGASNGVISDSWSLDAPNGVLVDASNQLIAVSFKANSSLQVINRADGTIAFEMGTNISDMDGITQDPAGTYYLSSWDDDQVYHFTSVMSPPAASDVAVASVNDPADIYYCAQYDQLIVPLFSDNMVNIYDAATLGIISNLENEDIELIAGPGNGELRIKTPDRWLSSNNFVEIYNMNGQLIRQEILNEKTISIPDLHTGTYILKFDLGEKVKTRSVLIAE